MTKKLLVIIPDRLSVLLQKGEVVPRYYNPGNLFDEVHIMMTNDDTPDPRLVQPMVGNASLVLHNFPEPAGFCKKTLGWSPVLMRSWALKAIELVRTVSPNFIRCHGLHLNTFLGVSLKEALNIACITSLHGNPDVDYLRGRLAKIWRDRLLGYFQKRLEIYCLKRLDHVIAVYSPIESYLQKHRVKNYSIIHNVVGLNAEQKRNYEIHGSLKLLCVGRQTHLQKDPTSILYALASLENAYLTLVGDGDLHQHLESLADKLSCRNRITFIKNMNNHDVLKLMKESDIYVYQSINYEISKTCIEAALVGLPIILNNRKHYLAKELLDAQFYLVDDTPQAYREAILMFYNDQKKREQYAQISQAYAKEHWAPEVTEQKLINLYTKYIHR